MMVHELKPLEFTERLEPIFRSVEARLPKEMQGRKAEYFFPRWRALMEMGVARAWELPRPTDGDGNEWGDRWAVIGLLITPDIFSGVSVAHIPFWFSLPKTKGTLELLDAAEAAAKKAKCKRISIAAFECLDGDRIAMLYRNRDYGQIERTFSKEL
jgi:hypothetical protein